MSQRYTQRILDHLAGTAYQPRQTRQLAADLEVDAKDYGAFRQSIEQLLEQGQVVLAQASTLALPPPGREMCGVFRQARGGFGFIIPDSPADHGDLFVPPNRVGGAMTGDRVRADILFDHGRGARQAGRSPYVGKIVEILQRADKQFVGQLIQRGEHYYVQPDGRAINELIVVRDIGAKNARIGQKVAVELLTYPEPGELGEGVIVEVLGAAGEPAVETRAVMRAYGLSESFDPAILEEARTASQLFDPGRISDDRDDLTDLFVCTIDPPDARDFDDAISIQRLKNEGEAAYELGVHIADVAAFVKAGGVLDEQAKMRGNSTYLPRRVIPMLPELLSNGVCSLQEDAPRYVKSVFIRFDRNGRVLSQRFARALIRSAKRLTYLEAQALIDDDLRTAHKHTATTAKYSNQLIQTLKLMDELARVIQQRRFKQGMIVLNLPTAVLVFDESGRVVDAQPEDNAYTHTIIEMFMVEANEAAARLFDSLDVPMIRRIHPDPGDTDLDSLRMFARVAGYNIPAHPNRKQLQQLLDAVRGKPQQHAVHLAVLKTLSKAEYAPLLIGHFALASEHYTHFTSPIRRYADLIVHRALDVYLDAQRGCGSKAGGKTKTRLAKTVRGDERTPDEPQLATIGRHCSTTERNSEGAERDLRQYLLLELLAERLGEDFQGTVTGVTGVGAFVQLDQFLVEGMIRLADLPASSDRWRFNRQTGALTAQRSGRVITIGDRFTVRLARVLPAARQLDLVIVEDEAKSSNKCKQPTGARQAHQKNMKVKTNKRKSARRQGATKKKRKKRK